MFWADPPEFRVSIVSVASALWIAAANASPKAGKPPPGVAVARTTRASAARPGWASISPSPDRRIARRVGHRLGGAPARPSVIGAGPACADCLENEFLS
jgi:hypothetical protein